MPQAPKISPLSIEGKNETEIPSFGRRLIAWPVSTNWGLGFLLATSFWMPHVRGCDGKVVVPVEDAAKRVEAGDYGDAIAVSLPYIFGLCTATLIIVCVFAAWRNADRILLGGQAFILCLIWGIGLISVLLQPSARYPVIVYTQFPPLVLTVTWIGEAIWRRDWITAWARLTNVMVLFSAFYLYVTHLFARSYFYGFYVACAAFVGLLVAPWMLRNHWERLLVDGLARPRRVQIGLRQLLLVMAMGPLLYGYYRYLPPLLGID